MARFGAWYEVVEERPDCVTIRDIGHDQGCKSVTNDAEAVVADLVTKGLLAAGQRLFYFDSQGELGEILLMQGRFAGFAFVGGSEEF